MENPLQSYGASPDVWDHGVTCLQMQVNTPCINLSQSWFMVCFSVCQTDDAKINTNNHHVT